VTWRKDDPPGNESGKIKWEIVKWTRGKGLDVGSGMWKTYPHFIGVDNKVDAQLFNQPINPDVTIDTAEKLDLFASQSMDFVFSSHLLEHIKPESVGATLKEWMRVIKNRGYLVLYLPDEDEYPKVGQPGANPDHKWNVNYDRVIEYMKGAGSWDLVDFQKRNEDKEYSLFFVFQKVGSGQHFSYKNKVKPEKTCGVVRYGAFGDLIQTSSILAALKKEGYHVTLYTSPPGDTVVKNDPNIDEFYVQDKDQVPNHLLGEFWEWHRKKYDKWVQLSESVEGSFLALPGRSIHEWPPALRHKLLNKNYLETMHEIAGVPYEPKMRFYATEDEKRWAKKERAKMGQFCIAWPVAGSSVHKTWQGLDNVIASLMLEFPQTHVVLMGNDAGRILQQGWEKEPRVHMTCGEWSIRQSLAFMDVCDMAIGPETGVMNAAAQLSYPKVVILSHSTDENLTRDWVNTHVLASDNTVCPGRGNNEAPACHQLHYGWKHCKKTDNGVAQCMEDITVEYAWRVIWHVVTWAMEKAA
jgi:ADP-heptose:LPS heptosyltransferase/predicted SAM-dependent methyltransferase